MKNKVSRIGSTVIVIGISIGLILLFTMLGKNSKGPLENFFTSIGVWIDNVDDKLLTKRASKKRSRSLSWFDPYRNELDSLKMPSMTFCGIYDNNVISSFQPIFEVEEQLEQSLPLIHIYSAWGNQSEHRFPLTLANSIYDLGSIPVLTWEPWLTAFDKSISPHLKDLEERDLHGLTDVVKGDYDFYLETFVEDVKTFGKPIYIRLGHEMNDPYRYSWGPQNNTNLEFIEFWQYVVDYFKVHHADNVIWIWSPHPAYGYFKEYYPGDEYVDWVGVGTLNYGSVAVWSDWWTFDEIYGNYYDSLAVFDKPIMLSEFGSLKVGGDRTEWYQEALCTLPEKYPLTRSVVFFHYDNDVTLTNKSLDWYFVNDTSVVKAIKGCMTSWDNKEGNIP